MNYNKFKKFLLIFGIFSMCCLVFSSFRTPHPFYVSVSELKYNSKSKQLSISCRVFANDIEEVFNKENKQKFDLLAKQNQEKSNVFFENYFKKKFIVSVNNKVLNLIYVGFEQEEEAIWVYFKLENIAPFKKVTIDNTILYNVFSEQNNIIHFYYDNNRQSNKLTNPESKHEFNF